ncbi:unnamed protein product, partial [Musa banksii]
FQLRCSLPSSPSLPPKASSRVNSVPFSTPSRRFVVRAEEASAPPPTGAGGYRSCQAATAKWPTERCRGICLYSSIIHIHTHNFLIDTFPNIFEFFQDPKTRYPVVVRFNKVNHAAVSTKNYALDEILENSLWIGELKDRAIQACQSKMDDNP